MRILSGFILAILSLFGTNFGTKNRLLALFSMKSGNWELGLSKKWMKRNILVQFLAVRKMRIFSEFILAILSLFGTNFGTENRLLVLFSIKSGNCELV